MNNIFLRYLPHLFLVCGLVSSNSAAGETLSEECKKIIHDKDAAQSDKKLCLRDFYKVLVTASRFEEELRKIPAAISSIAGRKLERPASDSVASAVKDLPGVDVSDAGEPGLKRIRIRGEDSKRVSVLIDGQELFDPRDVGTPVLIAPELLERIEVLRGPASVLYGSRAIGGVVNLITKKGGYHYPAQFSNSLSFDSNTRGFQHFESIYGGYKGFDYRVAYAGVDHQDRESADEQLDRTAYDNKSLLLYSGYSVGAHKISFNFNNFDGASEVYVEPEVRTSPPFMDFQIDAPQRDREKYGFFYDYEGREKDTLRRAHADAFLQHSTRQFNTFSKTVADPALNLISDTSIFSRSTTEGIGGNAYGDLRLLESLGLMLGVQASDDELDQSRLREVVLGGSARAPETVIDEASLATAALYGVVTAKPAESWELALGGRNYWVDSELDSTTRTGLLPQSNDDGEFIGSASLAYSGVGDALFWIKVAQGYQYPTLSQSATGAFAGPSFVNPNFDLESETSEEIEFGARYDDGAFSAELALFYSEAEDYIDHVLCSATSAHCIQPVGSRDRVYVNIDEATTYGAETALSYAFRYLRPYVTATWLRRKFESAAYSSYDTGLPALSSRVGLENEEELNPNVTWWSDLYVRMEADSDEFDGTTTSHKAGWGSLNAASGFDWGEKRQYRFSLELLNLFDKEYTPSTENIPAKGLTVLVKASFSM